jgi:HD-GYP domain-containing protein (c-di-GMP phosphodiesterase class II)
VHKVYIDKLRPGQVLGKTIYNERGDILLARGIELTSRYIGALRGQGLYAAYVLDGFADDLEPPDLLSDRVRVATYKHVRDLFDVAYTAASSPIRSSEPGIASEFISAMRPRLAQLYSDVERIIDEVSSIATISGVTTLKSHDSYTFEHSIEVTVVGVMLGERLYIPPEDLRQLALGCLCHDIGKLVVPPEVLLKPGRLTSEEMELVEQHPQAGYEAVQQIMSNSDIIARQVVWQHHERQDGTGYPRGFHGDNQFAPRRQVARPKGLMLPAAEIAAVADVYSALASDRPYRAALDPPTILTTLRGMAGNHLNREIVSRFLSILPAYPLGTEVVVISGKLQGYRGVVSELNPRDIHRPRIRIVFDSLGRSVAPFEVNTSAETDVELAMSSYADLAGPNN